MCIAARLREIDPSQWFKHLSNLNKSCDYQDAEGNLQKCDVLSRKNPAWAEKGVIAPGKTGPRVVNNRQAREGAYEYLFELLQLPPKIKVAA